MDRGSRHDELFECELPPEYKRQAMYAAGQYASSILKTAKLREKALDLAVAAVGPCAGESATQIMMKVEAVADRFVAYLVKLESV